MENSGVLINSQKSRLKENTLLQLGGAMKMSIATAATVEDAQFDTNKELELEIYSKGFIIVAGNDCHSKYTLQRL